jgi:hypothetical protein
MDTTILCPNATSSTREVCHNVFGVDLLSHTWKVHEQIKHESGGMHYPDVFVKRTAYQNVSTIAYACE